MDHPFSSVLILPHTLMGHAIDEKVALADFIRWMNAQKRPPGGESLKWTHTAARKQMDLLEVPLARGGKRTKGSKFYFRMSDLRRRCPLVADLFRPPQSAPARAEGLTQK